MFHGTAGAAARESFTRQYETIPTTLAGFDRLTRQPDLFEQTEAGKTWREALHTHAGSRPA